MKLFSNHFIKALSQRNPLDVVLCENKKSITAGDLFKEASLLATALAKEGVKQGHKSVIAVKPGIEFLKVIYANMMLGTIVSIIDPEMGRENYQAKLKQFSPNHAFVDSGLVLLNEHPILKFLVLRINKSIPSFPRIKNCKLFTTGIKLPLIQKNKHISWLIKKTNSILEFENAKEDLDFLVIYTSGTLSEPKGVVHSYASLLKSINHLSEMLQKNSDTIIATHLPHYALLGITSGIKVHLWNNNLLPSQKINFINSNKISTLFGPPSDFVPIINYLNQTKEKLPSFIKNIYLGSAPVYNSFLEKLFPVSHSIKITCLYGMTENLMVCSIDGHEKVKSNDQGDLVGFPFSDVTLSIANDGEVCLHSKQLFSHYWQLENSQKIHFTGDIGKLDNKGRLLLLGRKKDMIIRGNFNIYPGLYEPTINKINGIYENVMLGIYNPQKADEEVILVVSGESNLSESEIMKQLISGKFSIDKEALPDKIIFMDIPHSGRQNKINRKLLADQIKLKEK